MLFFGRGSTASNTSRSLAILTFLIVFKNSQTWSRFCNLGGVCNHGSLMRRLLFSTDLVCGAVGDECVGGCSAPLPAWTAADDARP